MKNFLNVPKLILLLEVGRESHHNYIENMISNSNFLSIFQACSATNLSFYFPIYHHDNSYDNDDLLYE